MKPIPAGICIALLAAFAWQSADAQRRSFKGQGTPKISYAYATDIVDAVDTFGLRTGMTLTEASSAAAAWGMDLSIPDDSGMDDGFIDGPGPDLFSLSATPNEKFRGFNAIVGGHLQAEVKVFPRDPSDDIRDPDNLIVYWITSSVRPPYNIGTTSIPPQTLEQKPSGAVIKRGGAVPSAGPAPGTITDIQRDAFFAQARQRFGDILDPETDGANQNQAHCSNAANIARMAAARGISFRAGTPDPLLGADDNPVVAAWRLCGDGISLVAATLPDGRVRTVQVGRFDTALAEAAYQSFRQFIGYHY